MRQVTVQDISAIHIMSNKNLGAMRLDVWAVEPEMASLVAVVRKTKRGMLN